MNSTCIHHEGSRPKYIHVQVIGNMHKTPYTMGENTRDTYTSNNIFEHALYFGIEGVFCMLIYFTMNLVKLREVDLGQN